MLVENNTQYQNDLIDINKIRYILFDAFYKNFAYMQNLTDIISKHIDCLSIDYSGSSYTYTIKIKKTAMRRYHGFKHDPIFYYSRIADIFKEFIISNEYEVALNMMKHYEKPYEVLHYLYDNPALLANLCHISCIADNILVVKL